MQGGSRSPFLPGSATQARAACLRYSGGVNSNPSVPDPVVVANILQAEAAFLAALSATLERAARLAGTRLACRRGCTKCCIGPFPINAADMHRLARGLSALRDADPARAARIEERAAGSVARYATDPAFPGDPATGLLADDEPSRERFCSNHVEEPCPALDPDSGSCDLYAHRPVVCRTFGPPIAILGVELEPCNLCFVGASSFEVDAARVTVDPDDLEGPLLDLLGDAESFVAFALAPADPAQG